MRCIEIMLHDDGTFHVRECPPREADDMEGGESFDSAEDAARAALELLTSDRAGEGSSEMQAAMEGGYNKVARKPPMGGMGGGNQFLDE